ncbi:MULTISPECIES: PucR family transcriptional regulator [Clostridium]|uniref:Sugar diacid utilization regulator n=2 Tax=Clostridium TaxID=1485 RepID=A0A1S9N603_CLOBE|nr:MULTISPECIES: PucR family transcriptional regulator [Clostridium]EKQ54835.1 MAG: sugar diacid utilization regulator [Clostridium sp. Maddingley MBC34-26]MZK51570.1 PucR family transcriptional regulator [Clostridium beijerinckii]MZK59845.1 PucR family transcriptional regulator [Clostridium beijerinckii]MZK70130.1 PucR family transcriptional regulator [Clostridium beijerinckii]MZK75373.1 PucR family transcriptional regulator [Clostridium beijerinckii]
MNCEDLLHIKQLKEGLELIAGESGLNRYIRWLYFADCIQCLSEDYDFGELIHGGELVIVTNESLTNNEKRMLEIIRTAEEQKVAGIVINEGQILDSVKNICNELEIPLFEISINLHLIDFSQIICKALVEEESNANSMERILSNILYVDNFSVENIIEQAQYYGINLNRSYQIAVFHIDNLNEELQKLQIKDNGYINEIKENIKKSIKREFNNYGLRHMMTLIQGEFAVALIPTDMFSDDLLIMILKNIVKKVEMSYHLQIVVGVGSSYSYIEEIKLSYQEAKNTIKISNILNSKEQIYFYNNLGLYAFLSQIKNDKFLDNYKNSKLKVLEDADKIQDGCLCDTLEAYLDNNCNANATAEALFIHRNTMRYRMDKIKKILGTDLTDVSSFLELKLAFAIKKYRDNISV